MFVVIILKLFYYLTNKHSRWVWMSNEQAELCLWRPCNFVQVHCYLVFLTARIFKDCTNGALFRSALVDTEWPLPVIILVYTF